MEDLKNICGSKYGQTIALALLTVLVIYVAALAVNTVKANKYVGRDTSAQSTISVAGTGEISTKPDLAVMDFSVVSEGKTVAEAMAENTKKMNAIVDVAKSLGVADNDLQTSGFNINPRYDYVKTGNAPTLMPRAESAAAGEIAIAPDEAYYPNGKRVLAGYDITQTLTVKMRDMTKIGKVIEETTAAGANQVGDLQFTLDDPEAAQAKAREKAIENAKNKAELLASQLKVKLVRIVNYSDGGYAPVYRLNYAAKDVAAGAAESVATPNIQTGENKITVNVNIVYEID